MTKAFRFELVSPECLLLSAEVMAVVIPGTEGYITVMAQHAPFMSTIKPGVIKIIFKEDKRDSYVVFGGFVDISPESCVILAESAVHIDELNRESLKRRIEDARENFHDATTYEQRTKAEQFLHQLMTLEGAILPA